MCNSHVWRSPCGRYGRLGEILFMKRSSRALYPLMVSSIYIEQSLFLPPKLFTWLIFSP
jgi:hypothetical protein